MLAHWTETWNGLADEAAQSVAPELEKVPRADPPSEAIERLRGERDELQNLVQKEKAA